MIRQSFCKGLLMLLGLGLMGLSGFSQRFDWRHKIDAQVRVADSLSLQSQQTFHLFKYLPDNRSVRETWHYTVVDGNVVIFEVHYFVDSIERSEVYYMDNGQVICMEQYEIEYPFKQEDRINWGAVGFFHGTSVRQYVTMGKVPEDVDALSSFDLWAKFKSRYKELAEQRTLEERK